MHIDHKAEPKRAHPFTQEIMDVSLPEQFKMPQIAFNEGKMNPNDHIEISIGYMKIKISELFFYNFASTTTNYYCDVNNVEGKIPNTMFKKKEVKDSNLDRWHISPTFNIKQ
ncbi:hypothetical protein TIFTF001_031534 [Ficus carica]|uniref:Uncharacterized protein n=1 Tax=Ficus carica TaxID=3494 RepID=A0AA88DXA9_FICCA|nr:hypothetical protein TIFTF001_031534 [Ficus carica]